MKLKRFLPVLQAVLCIVLAVWLSLAAVRIFLEGAALRDSEGSRFWIYTPEKAVSYLLPILPVLIVSVIVTIAGRAFGVRTDRISRPLNRASERVVSESISAEKHGTAIFQIILLAAAGLLILLGILNGGDQDVLVKAVIVCMECIGLG